MATREQAIVSVEDELRKVTQGMKAAPPAVTPKMEQGVADELAKFIEDHAQEMVKEAQQHLKEAQAFAQEIRDRTAEKIQQLRTFTDAIKESKAGMSEVRMKFLNPDGQGGNGQRS